MSIIERLEREEREQKFDGKSGMRPSAEARRYIYRVLAQALETDLNDPEGWILGGVKNEFDIRRLHNEAKKVKAELLRMGRI